MQDKNHMIISVDVGKVSDKAQHLFMIKTLSKLGVERAYLNIIKVIYEKTYSQHFTQWTKTKIYPTMFRNKTRLSAFTTPIQHSIGSPSHSDQTRKREKGNQVGKDEVKLLLFRDDRIVYVENPIDSIKKLLE